MINSLEKLEIVKNRGEAAQILGGWPSPPQAAKTVRAISRIEHHQEKHSLQASVFLGGVALL